jgi:hypothetical protein
MAHEIGVQLTMHGSKFTTEVSPLVKMMRDITYDPVALGLREAIPATVYRSLMQLGITSLGDLTHANGTHMISTTDLARKFGSKVTNKHKTSLNIPTVLLNEHAPDGVTMPKCGVLPLDKAKRKINRRQLAMELAAEVTLAPMSRASMILRRFLQKETAKTVDEEPHTSNNTTYTHKHATPVKRDRPPSVDTDSDSEPDPDEHMRCPHKRVMNLSDAASDKWAALYDRLRKLRGFTRAYNDKQRRCAALARIKANVCSVTHDKVIHLQGKCYTFTHDATTHAPTVATSSYAEKLQWTNPPDHSGSPIPIPPERRLHNKRTRHIQPRPLGLHKEFKTHIIRHTDHNTDGAVHDVIYADHAIPKAFLAEQWVAKGQKQLLTTWEPHVVMRKHLALWKSRGYTPKQINSVHRKAPSCNNTRKHWYGRGPAKHMVEVEWNDTWEPVEGFQQCVNFQAIYDDFRRKRNAPPEQRRPPTRQDMHLDKLARIGLGRERATYTPPCHRMLATIYTDSNPPSKSRHGHQAHTHIHVAAKLPPIQ